MKIKFGNIYQYDNNNKINSEDIKKKIYQRSVELKKFGSLKKKNVIINHSNSIEFFVDLFTIWFNDGCAICVDNTLSILELKNIIKQTSCKLILVKEKKEIYKELKNIQVVEVNKLNIIKNKKIPKIL